MLQLSYQTPSFHPVWEVCGDFLPGVTLARAAYDWNGSDAGVKTGWKVLSSAPNLTSFEPCECLIVGKKSNSGRIKCKADTDGSALRRQSVS